MFKFAATLVAATAATTLQRDDVYSEQFVAVSVEESYVEEINVLPDAVIAIAMEQGEGKTHILTAEQILNLFLLTYRQRQH